MIRIIFCSASSRSVSGLGHSSVTLVFCISSIISKLHAAFDVLPVPVLWQAFRTLRDVSDRNGHIAPDVGSNVHRIFASHPLVMNVAEKVERAASGAVPGDHRIVVEDGRRAVTIGDLGRVRD